MKAKDQEMYHGVWLKYLPVITLKLRQVARNGQPAQIGMYHFEFHTTGKKSFKYQFNLEVKNGRVMNDISKVLIAEELSSVMKDDDTVATILSAGHFLFSLDGNFSLTIQMK